ncbi:MAG: hypothetical protein Q9227_002545 [Pyrenula ochraceoflavens]
MSAANGKTVYKKQDGLLSVAKNHQTVTWTPTNPPDSKPSLTLPVSSITNLQQTPASSAKVMLKIFAQTPGQTEPVAHVFQFTSPSSARNEADTIRDILSKAIQTTKTNQLENAAPGGGQSAAMAIATAVSGGNRGGGGWDDDEKLKADVGLQQSLFKADPALQKTFLESLRTKPDSISPAAFTSQFWAARVHLLRAHAIERSQARGSYNVLSVLKPTTEDNQKKLNISREQIQLVFAQHPLVKRIYDREVPKPLREEDFWSRFFQSRLLKKLRGEKIDPGDAQDKHLDKYLNEDEFLGRQRIEETQVPRIIDLEGNEENHSQRRGNAPDFTLRPRSLDRVPIIKTLNSLSEKIMAQVAPSDVDPSQPIGMDEVTYNQLRLRDLQDDPEQQRNILKVRDQSHFFSDTLNSSTPEDTFTRKKRDPTQTIQNLVSSLSTAFPIPGEGVLKSSLPDPNASDESDSEDESPNNTAKANPSSQATSQILSLIRQHRTQTTPIAPSAGLSTTIYDRLLLTHATTTEFLSHFWSAFLSADPSRVSEIASLIESLTRAMDRIKAVADDAEAERNEKISSAKKQARAIYEKTGRKTRVDYEGIGGGKEVVEGLLGPTKRALARAVEAYQKALKEQMQTDEEA